MARIPAASKTLGQDPAVCAQCGVDRQNATPAQKAKLAPMCWNCIAEYIRTKGASLPPPWPGCKQCLHDHLCDLMCRRCGVWLHWTALIVHGAAVLPLDDYPAGFRIKYCAALGNPEWERPAAVAFLVDLLWRQRAVRPDERGPLDRYLAELHRVLSYEPALLGEAQARLEKELSSTHRWQRQREMPQAGEVLETLPIMQQIREPGQEG